MKASVLASLSAAILTTSGLGSAATIWTINIPSSIASYYDTVHGVENVFFMDALGGTNVLQHSASGWSIAAIANPSSLHNCAVGTTFTAYFDGSQGHLYCNDTKRHLLQFAGNPPGPVTDITAATSSVTIWGKPYTYSTCQNSTCSNVAGLTYPPTLGSYHVPSGQTTSGEHVFYPADDGALHESYYDTAWHDRTVDVPGSNYDPGQSYTGGEQGLTALWDGKAGYVYYVSYLGNLVQFSSSGTWSGKTLVTGASTPLSFLSSHSPAKGEQYLYGTAQGGGAADVFFDGPPETVQSETAMIATNPNISYNAAGQEQFFFIGSDRQVRDGISGLNITAKTGASDPSYDRYLPPPPAGSPYLGTSNMTGFWDGSCRHIFYVDGNGHVNEMYSCASSGNNWFENDLMPNPTVPAAN